MYHAGWPSRAEIQTIAGSGSVIAALPSAVDAACFRIQLFLETEIVGWICDSEAVLES